MDAREAIALAKSYINDVFGDEQISDIGLEEIRFVDEEDGENIWRVTIGFSRPWDKVSGPLAGALAGLRPRTYKVVELASRTGELVGISNRDMRAAA